MWLAILSILALSAIGGMVYMVRRFHRVPLLTALAEKHRFLSWLLAAVPPALCSVFFVFNGATVAVVLLHLLLFLLLCDLVGLVFVKLFKRPARYGLRCGAAILLTVVYLAIGWYNAHYVAVTRYTFPSAKLDAPMRIVEIADSHLGITLDRNNFPKELQRIQAENPDAVVVVGDFVDDGSDRADMIAACEALGRLQTTYGVFFVYGNHDEGYGNYRNFTAKELRDTLTQNGIVVLEDETVPLGENAQLVGRLDRSFPSRQTAASLTEALDLSRCTVMLDHQPNDYAAEAAAGADLVLSGHTHGGHIFPAGQIGLWIGANDFLYGTTRIGQTDFVVTSGISGWAIPFKTGTFSEYVVIDLVPKD
ncbi:MAG: metallophosphoesterase [Clostridia bacterium]|nr:metallophosphoesterase [Clostridia bacterium]